MTQPTAAAPLDPWEKFGWLMGAVWLVFLIFPTIELLTSDHAVVWRTLGVVGILTFAAVHISGFIKINAAHSRRAVLRAGLTHLAGMAVIAIALTPLIGVNTLGLLPYLVALAMFSLPLVWSFAFGGTAIAVCILAPLLRGLWHELWIFTIIIVLIMVTTGLIRVFDERGAAHRAMAAELALAAERDRVARDVHDVLGHSLTVVTVKAELAQRLIESDPDRAHEELAQIQALSRTALAEVRATVAGLRVASLADEVVLADVALSGAGIEANLPEDLSVVDPRHRVLLAWVLREAVTNVVRHSSAGRCTVELGATRLAVIDDGCGTDDLREGNGLRGVRERVGAAGGSVSLTTGPSGGTVLEVLL
jgi:two-component system sensor histidine kinase DesK